MSGTTFEQSILLSAPRTRVWDAITNPEEMALWFLPLGLGAQMKRDEHGTTFVCMMGMEIPAAVLEAIEPLHHVIIRGLPERQLAASMILNEEKNGTLLTVIMRGLELVPGDGAQERLAPIRTGWQKVLTNLQAYLNNSELPFPEGYVAALFGYRRETQKTFSVERSIWINATRQRVWEAITDPQQIQQWYSPTTPWIITDLKPGGKLYAPDPENGTERYAQMLDVVEPLICFVTRALPDLQEATIYTLTEEGSGTRLTITNTGYEWKAAELRHQSMEQNSFGYGMVLENLRAFIGGQSLPYPFGF
jgi:uncharacterized protein YndB with AHSA1/START domain